MGQVLPGFRGDAGASFPSCIYKATRKRTVGSAEAEEGVYGLWAESGRMATETPRAGADRSVVSFWSLST